MLFRLNNKPVRTEFEGDFDCIVLMDAASGFLLCTELLCVAAMEAWVAQARHLLKLARRHKKRLPGTILVANGVLTDLIKPEATRQGIDVISVAENQLLVFTSEPRQAFAQQFEGGRRK